MAHQAHNIPWNTLASHVRCRFSEPGYGEESYLVVSQKPGALKAFNYFIEAFLRNLTEHSACERAKYPAYDAPDPDDMLIDDRTALKIAPTVHRDRAYTGIKWHTERLQHCDPTRRPCTHREDDPACECPLPLVERRAAAFTRRRVDNDCYRFYRENDEAFLNQQVRKILLLHGEMAPLLRACHGPGDPPVKWYDASECYDVSTQLGWKKIPRLALRAYVHLNLLLCLPETWDAASGASPGGRADYRRLASYQRVVKATTCFSGGECDVAKYPHRAFFGIRDRQFYMNAYTLIRPASSEKRARYDLAYGGGKELAETPYGRFSYEEFLDHEAEDGDGEDGDAAGYRPTAADVASVRAVLGARGLPAELVADVVEEAGYEAARRLVVEHDPLHAANRGELRRYLTHCWLTIVRYDMYVREGGESEWWTRELRHELTGVIRDMAVGGGQSLTRFVLGGDEEYHWRSYGFKVPKPEGDEE